MKKNEGKWVYSQCGLVLLKEYYSCICLWACLSYKSSIQVVLCTQKLEKISVIPAL